MLFRMKLSKISADQMPRPRSIYRAMKFFLLTYFYRAMSALPLSSPGRRSCHISLKVADVRWNVDAGKTRETTNTIQARRITMTIDLTNLIGAD